MRVELSAAFEVEVEWELLPWLGDAMFKLIDVLFGPGVSAQTLVDNDSWGIVVFKGINQ